MIHRNDSPPPTSTRHSPPLTPTHPISAFSPLFLPFHPYFCLSTPISAFPFSHLSTQIFRWFLHLSFVSCLAAIPPLSPTFHYHFPLTTTTITTICYHSLISAHLLTPYLGDFYTSRLFPAWLLVGNEPFSNRPESLASALKDAVAKKRWPPFFLTTIRWPPSSHSC